MTLSPPQIRLTPHHCAFSVPDLERAVAWYCDKLAFTLESRAVLPHLGAKVAFLIHDTFRIELFELPGAALLPEGRRVPDEDLRTHGVKHVAFAVKGVAETVEHLRSRGVVIAMAPRTIASTCVAFVNDDSGNLIELVEDV
ncbi:MAG: VOC family protein [Alphaproteobacteria bacterium]|nr:VOC family protein [Alphaproteobacteria bacterium]MDE2350399.1 VOC family protein [Alphaproteobacteria bacterium]